MGGGAADASGGGAGGGAARLMRKPADGGAGGIAAAWGGGAAGGAEGATKMAAGRVGGLAAAVCWMNSLAWEVPSTPQAGQLTGHGIRWFTGSTSNLYFVPQAHRTLISMGPRGYRVVIKQGDRKVKILMMGDHQMSSMPTGQWSEPRMCGWMKARFSRGRNAAERRK